MIIIPVDLPNAPQQVIERNISIFQVKSSNKKKPKPEPTQEEIAIAYMMWERAMLIDVCKKAQENCLGSCTANSSTDKSSSYCHAVRAQVPGLILGILIDHGTHTAALLANEYIANNYKLPNK